MKSQPNISFPVNLIHSCDDEKKNYFDEVLGMFLDTFLLQKNVNPEDDYVKNYGLCTIFLAILLLQMKDTAKEGDGERNLINQKLLLTVFKSLATYSKYAIEMFVSIAQVESLLTPRLSEEFKWGYFSNWRGGEGNNIEDDLAQEITNKVSKNIVQRMGPNKTIESISKICKASNGIKEIIENFDEEALIHKTSVHHTIGDPLKDEIEMINDLIQLNPFSHIDGRAHNSFPNIKRSPLQYLNIVDFHQWLQKHKQEISGI